MPLRPTSSVRNIHVQTRIPAARGASISGKDQRVLATGLGEATFGNMRASVPIQSTAVRDGVNVAFPLDGGDAPLIQRDYEGRPLAAIVFRNAPLCYTSDNPPGPYEFTVERQFIGQETDAAGAIIDFGEEIDTIIVHNPPLADDVFYFLYLVVETRRS